MYVRVMGIWVSLMNFGPSWLSCSINAFNTYLVRYVHMKHKTRNGLETEFGSYVDVF
jgi:hypothetical protein